MLICNMEISILVYSILLILWEWLIFSISATNCDTGFTNRLIATSQVNRKLDNFTPIHNSGFAVDEIMTLYLY